MRVPTRLFSICPMMPCHLPSLLKHSKLRINPKNRAKVIKTAYKERVKAREGAVICYKKLIIMM